MYFIVLFLLCVQINLFHNHSHSHTKNSVAALRNATSANFINQQSSKEKIYIDSNRKKSQWEENLFLERFDNDS